MQVAGSQFQLLGWRLACWRHCDLVRLCSTGDTGDGHASHHQPPWDAPRDAVAYVKAAGLQELPVNITENQGVFQLTVTIDGKEVAIPAYIGIDRERAVQAAVQTHDGTGTVWLAAPGSDSLTLGQFFTLWGVRFDSTCLGAACGGVSVTSTAATKVGDPRELRLVHLTSITVAAHTG